MDLTQTLGDAPYPGRGLIVGRTDYGLFSIYFVTGRSKASRQRKFVTDGTTDLRIEDSSGAGDDPLRHYRAAGIFGRFLVVGNGRHVDSIGDALANQTVAETFTALEPEPDPPIYTPRIAAVVELATDTTTLGGAVRTTDGTTEHHAVSESEFPIGTGILITTYRGPVAEPSAWAVPTWIDLEETLDEQIAVTWDVLDPELRVGLASCVVGSVWSVDRQA
jgi:IMP cyclohydrolase